jgi:hypothetical protein
MEVYPRSPPNLINSAALDGLACPRLPTLAFVNLACLSLVALQRHRLIVAYSDGSADYAWQHMAVPGRHGWRARLCFTGRVNSLLLACLAGNETKIT